MSVNIVVNADVQQAGKQIQDFSKQSRIALTSLSLVAQDLPFGFIGIQNNLPSVISSFSNLTSGANGVKGGLTALGSALIGPGGLFLAFSAVTAAITFAIQKYGSVNNAIKALTSSNAKLVQVQNQLNKEFASTIGNTASETAKIQLLVKAINDTSKPMKDRQDAYVALKKIAPEIAKGIGKENELTEKNIQLINQNAQARIDYIKLRARENAILSIINKNEEERIALEQEYPQLLAKKQKAELAYNKTRGLSFDATKTFGGALNTEAINLESTTSALEKNAAQRRDLFKINNDLIGQLAPLIDGTSKYDAATKEFTDSLKKGKDEGLFDWATDMRTFMSDIEKFQSYVRANTNFQVLSIRKILAERRKLRKEENIRGDFGPAMALAPSQIGVPPIPGISQERMDEIKRLAELNLAGKETQKTFENVYRLLNESFFSPISDLFSNFLDTGKFAFKEFGNAVFAAIKALVAKVIATGIIALLATIFTGGGFAAASIGGGAAAGAGRFGQNLLGLLGFGSVASPSFAGVGGGQLGFGGSVSLTLRGSDLVGALNRTNTTISRVG
jgi:hypothetical protein